MTAMTEDGPFCVASQCGLCWYDFDETDHIGMYPDWNQVVEYRRERPKEYYFGGYRACVPACRHGYGFRLGCHASCLRILAPSHPEPYIAVAKRIWLNPLPPRRQRWLQQKAAASLALDARLPFELRMTIASHLIKEFAVCFLRSHPLGTPQDLVVDVAMTINMDFVRHEGRSYVRSLMSTHKKTSCPPEAVYVAADTCGIVDIVVCPTNVKPLVDPAPGVWWSTILLTLPHTRILVLTDGVKCRRVVYDGLTESDLPSWPMAVAPMPTRSFPWRNLRDPQPRQMVACAYSGPDVTGLSICCNPVPQRFHVHVKGESPAFHAIYDGTREGSSWVYYPVAKGERITAMWIRQCRYNDSELAILMETSNRRAFIIGARGWRVDDNTWVLADAPEGRNATFHYDLAENGTRELIFTSPSLKAESDWDDADMETDVDDDTPTREVPRLVPPRVPCPRSAPQEWYMWNVASTAGIASLRACVRTRLGRKVIRGLVLTYCDGLVESVGEVRFDSLTAPRRLKDGAAFWFQFDRTSDGCPHLVDIAFHAPEHDDTRFMPVYPDGTMEWWFSHRQCLIWHAGRVSPRPVE